MSTQNLYLLVGPSGSGETTVANNLYKKYGFKPVVSYTTRPIRKNEKDGVDHFFISSHQFAQLSDLVAYTEFNGHQYGVTKELLNKSDIYVIDPDGVDCLMKYYDDDRIIIVIGIKISEEECAKHMRIRGDSDEMIKERLLHDKKAFNNFESKCKYLVDGNTNVEKLTEQVWNVISNCEFISKEIDEERRAC